VTTEPDPLDAYATLLATTAVEWGLIGPAEPDRIWERHIRNSTALAPLIGQGASVLDVGSGAGLPGIPLAIARPDLDVTLLEPMARRVRFLESAVADLGLDHVTVVRARAEDVTLTADVVVARAVAPLEKLVRVTRHLFPEGELLALKGDKAPAEIAAAARALAKWGLAADLLYPEGATVVRVRHA